MGSDCFSFYEGGGPSTAKKREVLRSSKQSAEEGRPSAKPNTVLEKGGKEVEINSHQHRQRQRVDAKHVVPEQVQ